MKRPDFMKGVELEVPAAMPSAPRTKNVAWAPSAPEPALPELKVAPVIAPPPAPPPSAFVALPSAPPPVVPPPAELSAAMKLAVETLRVHGERLAEQARSDSLELGVLIARRILEREISTDLGAVFSLIRSAIRRAGEDHVTKVRVSARDLAEFQAAAKAEFSLGSIVMEADPSLQRGDVVVETAHQSIDGRVSTRMAEIVKALEASRGES